MKKPYDLDKLLCLLEERESILAKIQTFELPEFLINNEKNIPVYRIHFSRFGDLVIQRNINVSANLGSPYSDLREITQDLDASMSESYLLRAMANPSSPFSRPGRLRRANLLDSMVNTDKEELPEWSFVLAIPINKCLDITQSLFNIFRDDILNNSE